MTVEGIVFDLDDTLLDTSSLRAARSAGDWGSVKALLETVAPFPSADEIAIESLPSRVRSLGIAVGILTHAPRWYAETLTSRFEIEFDVMITGSDPYPPKPDPTSLRQMAADLGVDTADLAFVGDAATDTAAAAAAHATGVGVSWRRSPPGDWQRWWPDIAVSRPRVLLDVEKLSRRWLVGEVLVAGEEPAWHWGSFARPREGVFACGRYFTREDVDRHATHALSSLILDAKDSSESAGRVAEIFGAVGERLSRRTDAPPALIVSVPPRPDATFDRFSASRHALSSALGAADGEGAISMEFDIADYKYMNHDERRLRNEGRFRSVQLSGDHVLLIDDVITSGSQAESCREELLRAGASKVTILALAMTQSRLAEPCPMCGATLRVYNRHRDGRPFIGCPNYFITRCPYTRDAGS